MTIKSHLGEALEMKGLLDTNSTGIQAYLIPYTTESTLSALSTGKSVYQTAENSISEYKDTLTNDADNIGSLGEEFSSLDEAIGISMRKYF